MKNLLPELLTAILTKTEAGQIPRIEFVPFLALRCRPRVLQQWAEVAQLLLPTRAVPQPQADAARSARDSVQSAQASPFPKRRAGRLRHIRRLIPGPRRSAVESEAYAVLANEYRTANHLADRAQALSVFSSSQK